MNRVKTQYIDFKNLKKHLSSNEPKRLTFAVDKLFLKSRTLEDLFKAINQIKSDNFPESNDFKSIAIVKKHIRYRQAHGWQFSLSKASKIRLVGYDMQNLQDSLF